MEHTARFQIPLLAPGQAQKEFFHNEALERIACLICPVVEDIPQAAPPADPTIGACYLVGAEASGDWSGNDGSIACFTAGGWRFIEAVEGLSVTVRATCEPLQWCAGVWELGIARFQEVRIRGQTVLRERQPAIPNPAGGTIVDSECRAALTAVLNALRTHGMIS
jgi:hypothetical protein